jgi:hypothetical protein
MLITSLFGSGIYSSIVPLTPHRVGMFAPVLATIHTDEGPAPVSAATVDQN